ncbi:hypothetical protein S140_17 [Shewanella sp. phage 1/40]|nr:hypothetical protein S140_17 [Shewanella sp. phage 1/40]AHK11427.1 hypothetical protein S140_17 [Shewanella sp. phage 1/40]
MELSSIHNTEYAGALSTGLTDLCDDIENSQEYTLTDEVDFAIIITNLN